MPDTPRKVGGHASSPATVHDLPPLPTALTTPASGLRDTLATWLRTHALADLEDPAVIDSLTTTVTQATPAAFPTVQGHCPACGGTSLFLGAGGYPTCARIECPQPDAATTLLERDPRRPDHAYAGYGGPCLAPPTRQHCDQPREAHDAHLATIRVRPTTTNGNHQ